MKELTWMAIVNTNSPHYTGYVLDAYPDELEKYRNQLGNSVISEHSTAVEARQAVRRHLGFKVKQQ